MGSGRLSVASRPTQDLLARHGEAWQRATRHPFLNAVRDGTLPPGAFATWLAQDYRFVADLLVIQAHLLARAPRAAQGVLAGGVVALEAELAWFERHAEPRGLRLDAPRHPTTRAYQQFLLRLENAPYPAAIAALWAMEGVYLESWTNAAPGHPDYREFVEHWTVPEFVGYVQGLALAVDAALAAGEHVAEAEAAFLTVLDLEHAFWEMAWAGGAAAP